MPIHRCSAGLVLEVDNSTIAGLAADPPLLPDAQQNRRDPQVETIHETIVQLGDGDRSQLAAQTDVDQPSHRRHSGGRRSSEVVARRTGVPLPEWGGRCHTVVGRHGQRVGFVTAELDDPAARVQVGFVAEAGLCVATARVTAEGSDEVVNDRRTGDGGGPRHRRRHLSGPRPRRPLTAKSGPDRHRPAQQLCRARRHRHPHPPHRTAPAR